jgi:adenine phosphoribosyltransferase
MNNYYNLKVAGIERKLKKVKIKEHLSIASFVMLGDTELVERTADELVKRIPKGIDIIVCPEAKGIALAHAIAVRLNLNYVILRKSIKGYMEFPIVEEITSITTKEPQKIVINGIDIPKIRDKRVCIVDDVVSTGGSLRAVEKILSKVGCKIVSKVAVLLEEGGYNGELTYLKKLPIFRD